MNIFNARGMKLLDYKKELAKDYPQIVHNSLLTTISQMAETQLIEADVHYLLKEPSTTYPDFEDSLRDKSSYTKTQKELEEEYDILKEVLNNKLSNYDLADKIITKSYPSVGKIKIIKIFSSIDEEFLVKYFDLSDEDVKLFMKRQNFAEKFAIIRLTKIFKDFFTTINISNELFDCFMTKPYYEKSHPYFGIALNFDINIETIEDESKHDKLLTDIKMIVDAAESYYECRMVI